jgi:hypothetical protein
MPVISITRLRLRSWRFFPGFALYAVRSRMQASRAAGNCGMNLMREPGNVFWTVTVWESAEAVKQFMVANPHGQAMRRLMEWCDEAAVARGTQDTTDLPDWQQVHHRLQTEGRPSKVRYPSAAQQRFEIAAPRKR